MSDVAIREIAALVQVAAGHQSQVNGIKHLHKPAARRHRDIAHGARRQLRIIGGIQKQWLVQEQRHRPAIGACELLSQPVELLGLTRQACVHHH